LKAIHIKTFLKLKNKIYPNMHNLIPSCCSTSYYIDGGLQPHTQNNKTTKNLLKFHSETTICMTPNRSTS